MKVALNRREFVSALAAVPFAANGVLAAQAPSIPIIDTHIHLWDRTRPGTAHGCPDDDQHLCYPQNDAMGLTLADIDAVRRVLAEPVQLVAAR